MDKYEYNVKSDQIKKLYSRKEFAEAAAIADEIDWYKVKDNNMINRVADIYEHTRQYERAKEILLIAYERSPLGRQLAYKLTILALRTKNFVEADEFYQDFVEMSPSDVSQYLLKYRIAKAKGEDIDVLISILEAYIDVEMDERWQYELAKLYHEAGYDDKCIAMCNDLELWFNEGKYVEKARELRKLITGVMEEYNKRYASNSKYTSDDKKIESNADSGNTFTEPSLHTGNKTEKYPEEEGSQEQQKDFDYKYNNGNFDAGYAGNEDSEDGDSENGDSKNEYSETGYGKNRFTDSTELENEYDENGYQYQEEYDDEIGEYTEKSSMESLAESLTEAVEEENEGSSVYNKSENDETSDKASDVVNQYGNKEEQNHEVSHIETEEEKNALAALAAAEAAALEAQKAAEYAMKLVEEARARANAIHLNSNFSSPISQETKGRKTEYRSTSGKAGRFAGMSVSEIRKVLDEEERRYGMSEEEKRDSMIEIFEFDKSKEGKGTKIGDELTKTAEIDIDEIKINLNTENDIYNTANIQEALAKSMEKLMNSSVDKGKAEIKNAFHERYEDTDSSLDLEISNDSEDTEDEFGVTEKAPFQGVKISGKYTKNETDESGETGSESSEESQLEHCVESSVEPVEGSHISDEEDVIVNDSESAAASGDMTSSMSINETNDKAASKKVETDKEDNVNISVVDNIGNVEDEEKNDQEKTLVDEDGFTKNVTMPIEEIMQAVNMVIENEMESAENCDYEPKEEPIEEKPEESKEEPIEEKPEEPKAELIEEKPEEPKEEELIEEKPEEPKEEEPIEEKPEEPKEEPIEEKPEEPKKEKPIEEKSEEPKEEEPIEEKPEEPKEEKPEEPKAEEPIEEKPEESKAESVASVIGSSRDYSDEPTKRIDRDEINRLLRESQMISSRVLHASETIGGILGDKQEPDSTAAQVKEEEEQIEGQMTLEEVLEEMSKEPVKEVEQETVNKEAESTTMTSNADEVGSICTVEDANKQANEGEADNIADTENQRDDESENSVAENVSSDEKQNSAESKNSVENQDNAENTNDSDNQNDVEEKVQPDYSYKCVGHKIPDNYRSMFNDFVSIDSMEESIADTLDNLINHFDMDGTSKTNNVIVTGSSKIGKTTLGLSIIKAANRGRNRAGRRVAKVKATVLNKRGVSLAMTQILGTDLIIEQAGNLMPNTLVDLMIAMKNYTEEMLIVLEDDKAAIDRMLNNTPDLKEFFTNRLDIEEMEINDMVKIAKEYAAELFYEIDEMGELALSAKLDDISGRNPVMSIEDIQEVVDEAIAHANRFGIGKLLGKLKKGKGDMKVLSEQDFL